MAAAADLHQNIEAAALGAGEIRRRFHGTDIGCARLPTAASAAELGDRGAESFWHLELLPAMVRAFDDHSERRAQTPNVCVFRWR